MFLRHAPLAAADYLFLSYTYSPVAAADLAYYMYGNMIAAAREVYGSDDITEEDLRRRCGRVRALSASASTVNCVLCFAVFAVPQHVP